MADKLTDIQEVQQVQTDIMLQNEDNADNRYDECEANADNRYDHGESTADQRCSHISNRVGRTGWNIIAVIIAVTALTTCFAYNHVSQLNDKINELESTVAMHGDNKALKAQNTAMAKAIKSKNSQIIALHQAADREKQMHHQYYKQSRERADGYIDHIMSLNEQLEEADKNTERFKIRNDVKKQFLEMSFAIAENNPHRFREAVGDDSLPEMRFYPLAVKMAIGLGSLDVLEYIQTHEGWDKTIPKDLVDHVKSPVSVPLKKYEQLLTKGKKMKGLQADQDKIIAAQNSLIKELKSKVYDEKYLPYSTLQVMYFSAYHTVAENVRPKELTKWVGKATPEEWIGYLRMAVSRNSPNVYQAIMELDEVTSIPEVKAYIESTSVLANLLR